MAPTTDENAIVPSDVLTGVEGASDMADKTRAEKPMAEKLLNIISRREGGAVVVFVDEWAYADWSDYDITEGPVLITGHVEDYSEKAYKLTSAFQVHWDLIEGKSVEEVQDDYVTNLIDQVDETDEDFHDERGEMFLPKSAVESIIVTE